jgi:hypothetical protein
MKPYVLRAAATAAGLVLLSCGGGGTPTSPTVPAATPTPQQSEMGLQRFQANQEDGGAITYEYGPSSPSPDLSPRFRWTVTFRATATIANQWVRVRLLRSDGRSCLRSAELVGAVTAGGTYTVSGSDWDVPDRGNWQMPCGDSFTTTGFQLQLISGNPWPGGVDSAADVQDAARGDLRLTFTRTGDTGAPDP